MNSVANRPFDRSRSPSLGLGNNSPFHVGIGSTMTLGTRVFLLLVTLVTALRPMAAHAVGSGDCAGLVDIGGGRKIYLECHGTGSPTVVLISGTRGAHDDWTDLIGCVPTTVPEPLGSMTHGPIPPRYDSRPRHNRESQICMPC